jgi:hypothetical protein
MHREHRSARVGALLAVQYHDIVYRYYQDIVYT